MDPTTVERSTDRNPSDSELQDDVQSSTDLGSDAPDAATAPPSRENLSPTPSEAEFEMRLQNVRSVLIAASAPFFCNGSLPFSAFSLIAKADADTYTTINWPLTSNDVLAPLIDVCKEATFGRGNLDVLDPTYRSALVLHADSFTLMPGSAIDPYVSGIIASIQETLTPSMSDEDTPRDHRVIARLDKLNIYKEGDFFKKHVDTPQSTDMIGTLVVNLPTPHVGGQLVIQEPNSGDDSPSCRKHTCDWGKDADIGWVAFYSDCGHEVLPVASGHRVTLSYTLTIKGETGKAQPFDMTKLAGSKDNAREQLAAALRAPGLFNESRTRLCFYLEHIYPVDASSYLARHIVPKLKGKDLITYHAILDAGLGVTVHHVLKPENKSRQVLLLGCSEVVSNDIGDEYYSPSEKAKSEGDAQTLKKLKMVEVNSNPRWENELLYMTYGNESSLETEYTALALVATRRGAKIW